MIYGALEIEIMNAIWSLQNQNEDANISVNDIVNCLRESGIQRAYTTVKTVMDRLVIKGILARYRNLKKFYYRSTIDKDEAAQSAIETIATQFFGGNHVQMIRFIEKKNEHLLV